MVSITYFLSALTAVSAVQAAPGMAGKRDGQTDSVQQTANDANAVSNQLAGVNQQLQSGSNVTGINFGPIISDVQKLLGDVTKMPNPSNLMQDASDAESLIQDIVGAFSSLGKNFEEFLNAAGPQKYEGESANVVGTTHNVLQGLLGKIEGLIGNIPQDISNAISEFHNIINSISSLL